jgi:hypothetical protein
MSYLISGLAGVLVGAFVTLAVALIILQRRADRDLIERRLRALLEYRERLGDPRRWFSGNGATALQAEQFLQSLDALIREFRLTAWLFDEPIRRAMAGVLEEIERALDRYRESADPENPAQLAPLLHLCERFDKELRCQAVETFEEHRRFRFLPSRRPHSRVGGVVSSEENH